MLTVPFRRRLRYVLLTVFGFGAVLGIATVFAQAPATPARPRAGDPAADHRHEMMANIARDELEILKTQLDAKKELIRIGEERLAQAKTWHKRYEGLLRDGKVTEEYVLAARDDVLMMETHLAIERSEIKLAEIRVKQAQRRLDYGEFEANPIEPRLSEIDQKLTSLENKLDRLQHEVGRLRRQNAGIPK